MKTKMRPLKPQTSRRSQTTRWTEFAPIRSADKGEITYRNSLYTVTKRPLSPNKEGSPEGFWLSISRRDQLPIHDWRDLQRIKNEIVGPEAEGVELYPAESRLADSANQYHLWVFTSFRFPFGFEDRLVSEESVNGSVQRPWDNDTRPNDLATASEIVKRIKSQL